jgi:hypothetical protein
MELLADAGPATSAGTAGGKQPRSPTLTWMARCTSTSSTAVAWSLARPGRAGDRGAAGAAPRGRGAESGPLRNRDPPRSSQLAVDNDADVMNLVGLPLRQPSRRAAGWGRIRIRIGDARVALENPRPSSFDVVVADLFAAARTPAHLTSVEFAAAAARRGCPPGCWRQAGCLPSTSSAGPPLAHPGSEQHRSAPCAVPPASSLKQRCCAAGASAPWCSRPPSMTCRSPAWSAA